MADSFLGTLSIGILAAALASACGSGMDTEQAQATCDRERQSDATCVNDSAYQQCVACYEDCGVDCARAESCPVQFICE